MTDYIPILIWLAMIAGCWFVAWRMKDKPVRVQETG